jgi:hypothetical protein
VVRLNTHDQQIVRPSLFSGTLGFIRQARDVIHISAKNRIMHALCFQSPRLKLYIQVESNIIIFITLIAFEKNVYSFSGNMRAPP